MHNGVSDKKFIEAEQKFEKAEDAVRTKDFQAAKTLLREVIELNPHFVYAYILLARVFWKTGSRDSAKQTIEKCIAIDRSFGYSYYLLAKYSLTSGDKSLVADYLAKGMRADPHNQRLKRITSIMDTLKKK